MMVRSQDPAQLQVRRLCERLQCGIRLGRIDEPRLAFRGRGDQVGVIVSQAGNGGDDEVGHRAQDSPTGDERDQRRRRLPELREELLREELLRELLLRELLLRELLLREELLRLGADDRGRLELPDDRLGEELREGE